MPNNSLKILFLGDVVGSLGRQGVKKILPTWKKQYKPDLIIANIENLAHGKGITLKTLREINACGIDLYTGGNHIWSKEDILDIAQEEKFPIAYPANDSRTLTDYRWQTKEVKGQKITVISLSGKTFMKEENLSNPFLYVDKLLTQLPEDSIIILDFHAEATSEKRAMGLYLDGKISALIGTHTHVPTNDGQILAKGTGYISDVGMIGPYPSVIGVKPEIIINKFLTDTNIRHEYADSGQIEINALILEVDKDSKKTLAINNIRTILD